MDLQFKRTCFKLRFDSRKEAKSYLKKTNNSSSNLKKPLVDVYYCDECEVWHLTSRPKEDRDFFRNNKHKTKRK